MAWGRALDEAFGRAFTTYARVAREFGKALMRVGLAMVPAFARLEREVERRQRHLAARPPVPVYARGGRIGPSSHGLFQTRPTRLVLAADPGVSALAFLNGLRLRPWASTEMLFPAAYVAKGDAWVGD